MLTETYLDGEPLSSPSRIMAQHKKVKICVIEADFKVFFPALKSIFRSCIADFQHKFSSAR